MDFLVINPLDTDIVSAKAKAATHNLTLYVDCECPRGWMFFCVNDVIWGRQYAGVHVFIPPVGEELEL